MPSETGGFRITKLWVNRDGRWQFDGLGIQCEHCPDFDVECSEREAPQLMVDHALECVQQPLFAQ